MSNLLEQAISCEYLAPDAPKDENARTPLPAALVD
jgi:hypothetical protein